MVQYDNTEYNCIEYNKTAARLQPEPECPGLLTEDGADVSPFGSVVNGLHLRCMLATAEKSLFCRLPTTHLQGFVFRTYKNHAYGSRWYA